MARIQWFHFVLPAVATAVNWQPVRIGGGGYAAAVVTSNLQAAGQPNVFFRTDVGGIYRLVNDSNSVWNLSWKPLLMNFTYAYRNWYGGDSLATSGVDSGTVYTSTGAYFESDEVNAGIWRSTDAGESWTPLHPCANGPCSSTSFTPSWSVRAGSNNSTFRGMGERLAVHPFNDSCVLYGSYLDGLWRTGNAASAPTPTWQRIPSACDAGSTSPLPCNNSDSLIGALSLIFDAASSGGNTVLGSWPVVYGAEASGLGGVFLSADAGLTWKRTGMVNVSAVLPPVNRFAAALAYNRSSSPPTVLPVPAGEGSVVWAATRSGLYRTDGSAEYNWLHVPNPLGDVEFSGIDVSPWDPYDVIAMTHVDSAPYGLVRTVDGGSTWSVLPRFKEVYQLPWWPASFMSNDTVVSFNWGMSTSMKFSPWGSGQAWLGDGWNMWLSPNFDLSLPVNANGSEVMEWMQQPYGHEEVFVLSLVMPHAGPFLLTGTADLSGVVHATPDLGTYPNFCWFGGPWGWGGEGTGADYTESITAGVPSRIVVAHTRSWPHQDGQGGGKLYLSDDGAKTWTDLLTFNETYPTVSPGGVAISAYNPDVLIVIDLNDVPLRSSDGGVTWARVPTLPPFPYPYVGFSGNRYNQSRALVADRPTVQPPPGTPGVFYYHCAESGVFYVSRDDGATFTASAHTLPPSPRVDLAAVHSLSATGGHVLVALDKQGLWTSADSGSTFSQLPGVLVAHAIAVGAPSPSAPSYPVLYLVGLTAQDAGGDYRPYMSKDQGATWVDISSSNGLGLGNWLETMAASRQQAGVVVVGSFGTGAFWANVSSLLL